MSAFGPIPAVPEGWAERQILTEADPHRRSLRVITLRRHSRQRGEKLVQLLELLVKPACAAGGDRFVESVL